MTNDKDRSRIEIVVDAPFVPLKGVGVDVEPGRLAGHVTLHLNAPTALKEITLNFRGKAILPNPNADSLSLSSTPISFIVCNHDWSFLVGEKTHSHTLKAGRHLFPFELRLGGSMPSTVDSLGGASITYRLRAEAVRAGFGPFCGTLHASLPIPVIRSFAPEAMEYQQTLEIENSWPEKLMYSVMIPHKAWAAGDRVTAVVKCSPLAKGISVQSVNTSIDRQAKVVSRFGSQEFVKLVANVRHDIVDGRPMEVTSAQVGQLPHPQPSSLAHRRARSLPSLTLESLPSPFQDATLPPTMAMPTLDSSSQDPAIELPSSDLITTLSIYIPPDIPASHGLGPLVIAHRIRWHILIMNPDGHTSELRLSLPLHILDNRLLAESRSFSGPTRRLLLGLGEESEDLGTEEILLPSYDDHVRDRVANMYLPESATMRVANPWLSLGASPTFAPEHVLRSVSLPSAVGSTPSLLEVQSSVSTQSSLSVPLEAATGSVDWMNSELFISLGGGPSSSPDRFARRDSCGTSSVESSAEDHSGDTAAMNMDRHNGDVSRGLERKRSIFGLRRSGKRDDSASDSKTLWPVALKNPFASRVPKRHHTRSCSDPAVAVAAVAAATRDHGALSIPYSSFAMSTSTFDTASSPALPSLLEMTTLDAVATTSAVLLHRAFTETPDYAVASRGFLGGVPPLSSMVGLPSYDETTRSRQLIPQA